MPAPGATHRSRPPSCSVFCTGDKRYSITVRRPWWISATTRIPGASFKVWPRASSACEARATRALYASWTGLGVVSSGSLDAGAVPSPQVAGGLKVGELPFPDAHSRDIPLLAQTAWDLTNALLDYHLSGSDTAAIGGDLAYQYGATGSLSGVGITAAQEIVGNAGFGVEAQALKPPSELQAGALRLE